MFPALSLPVYFHLGLLGPNQLLLPALAAKKAKMAGNRIIMSRPIISHLLGLVHCLLR